MVLHQPEFKVKNRVKIAANPRKLIYNLFDDHPALDRSHASEAMLEIISNLAGRKGCSVRRNSELTFAIDRSRALPASCAALAWWWC
jgi:hypothetical protein